MKKLHWTQTPEGRARMKEIALRVNNIAKARQVRLAKYNNAGKKVRTVENIEQPKEAQLPKKRETTISVYDWQVTLSDNEIRIIRK